ncbi:hypothetical protein L915_12848, partial [Phytophthora nicotianae]
GALEYQQKLLKYVLPCDLEKAARVTWKAFEFQHHQRDRQVFSGFGHPKDTVEIRFRSVRLYP